MNDFCPDDVLLYVPSKVKEHVVIILVSLLLTRLLIPLLGPNLLLVIFRNGQHGIEIDLMFGCIDYKLLKSVITKHNVLEIESLKAGNLIRIHITT